MNSDEEESSIRRIDAARPFSGLQMVLSNPPPIQQGGRTASLSIPRPNPSEHGLGQQQQGTIFDGEGASNSCSPMLDAPVVMANLTSQPASSDNSIHPVLSSGCASSESSTAGDGLKPALVIGVNPRLINHAQENMSPPSPENQRTGNSSQMAGSIQGSMATRSRTLSMVDREVLVMREAVELSSSTNPTPLGQQRRLSLFERAHSVVLTSSNDGDDQDDIRNNRSERRSSAVIVKGRNIDSIDLDASQSLRNAQSHERDKYNTVLRDWLMHVLEKDDQHDAEVIFQRGIDKVPSPLSYCTIFWSYGDTRYTNAKMP